MAMEKILTKAEIEALLNAVFDGRIEPKRNFQNLKAPQLVMTSLIQRLTVALFPI